VKRSACFVRLCLVLVAGAGVGVAGAGVAGAVEPGRLGIGVAPFESRAPPGAVVPDMATLLADRLGTRGVGRVIGPAQLGASPDIDASDEQVHAWAQAAEVDAIVMGRSTRVGDALSLEVWLRSGASGEVARTYTEDIGTPQALEASLDDLVTRLLEGAGELPVEPTAAPVVAAGLGGEGSPFGFKSWNSKEPLKIESERLEAVQKDGRRKLVFRDEVHVQQGDLSIRCSVLEAFYPKDGNQPDRLVARGNVRMVQAAANQSASCDLAVYDRRRDRFTCSGNASFRDGDNTLRGAEIDVDLDKETVTVKGGAELFIHPDSLKGSGE
jgi:lipopolysaccharide transport protein LptA